MKFWYSADHISFSFCRPFSESKSQTDTSSTSDTGKIFREEECGL